MVLKYLLLHNYFGETLNNLKESYICNDDKEHKNIFMGLLGVSILLTPHILNSFRMYYNNFKQKDYNTINIIGSSMLSYYSFNNSNYPLLFYSGLWGITSTIAKIKNKFNN